VSCHLFALVVGHGDPFLGIDAVEHAAEAGYRGVGGAVGELGERYEQSGAFDDRTDGSAAGALNRVTLPVARYDAFVDLRGPEVDRDPVRDLTAPIFAPGTGSARSTSLTSSPMTSVRSSPRGIA